MIWIHKLVRGGQAVLLCGVYRNGLTLDFWDDIVAL